jgi:hypothetical protein
MKKGRNLFFCENCFLIYGRIFTQLILNLSVEKVLRSVLHVIVGSASMTSLERLSTATASGALTAPIN